MIFNEIYSAYYNCVAKILEQVMAGNTDERELNKIVDENAFGESAVNILPSLKSEKWQLVKSDFTTPIKHKPTMPLTIIQKQWLKAVMYDRRIRLFDIKIDGLDDVGPLFTDEDYFIYDKYSDGDPYDDEKYIEHFRTILKALNNGRNIKIEMTNRRGKNIYARCVPEKLEYSEKDDKFRLVTSGCPFLSTVNIAKITKCSIYDGETEILRAVAPLLLEQGYDIKVFNLINPQDSDGYNPFVYVRTDEDVIKLITNLIQNTTPKNAQQNDPFWEKSEIALDTALMLYLLHEAPPEEQTFEMLMFLIENAATVEDDDDGYQSPVDMLFEALEDEKPEHIALKQYKIFKQASGKTAKSILISAAVRLAAFNLPEIAKMTSYDNLDLGELGEKKRAIFCVIPDNDNSFNYLVGMLYTQAFQELYYKADHEHGGELPVPVHFVMDEFANVALPDNFERLLATMRSRRISVSIIIQNMAQLKALFKDSWESLVGNCDTMLYLGGNEQSTHEYISKMLGKETIDTRTRGITKGQHGSSNTNYQNAGRELLTLDEVRLLDNSNALIFIRGEKPIMDKKFDILTHPNIKKTVDGGAMPYVHSKSSKFLKDTLSVKLDEVDGEIILSEETIKSSGITFVEMPVHQEQEQEEKKEKLPLKERVKSLIIRTLKSIKTNLWRLLRNEKK